MRCVVLIPQRATRDDFAEILRSLGLFWGERDVAHLHHPMAVEEFGESALVMRDGTGRVAAYLFGMVVSAKRVGYVHVVAVRDDQRGRGHGRQLYGTFTDLVAARGCIAVKAVTTPQNTASIAFHTSIGMHGREVADYSGPGRTRIVFRREFSAAPWAAAAPTAAVELRTARPEDAAEIVEFWRLAAEDTDRPTDRREAVERLIERDAAAVLLAVIEGRVVGCVAAGWDGWRAHLYRLAVHPQHRRRGLATWLLNAAEQHLRDQGAIRIDAMVLDENESAHPFWSIAGYTRQPSWSRWVKTIES